jgi:hypothetical protein
LLLSDFEWKLLRVSDDTEFLTSDNPVSYEEFYIGSDKKLILYFPLDKDNCIILVQKDIDYPFLKLTMEEDIERINTMIAKNFDEYLIASNVELIEKYLNK